MPNVAVIVLDTLRKDVFDEHFDWLPGTRFERAYAPSHYTVPVHASLFTGQYPSEAGVHAKHERFDCDRPVLPERLRTAGYTTRAFSANSLLVPERDFHRGFDEFREGWRIRASRDDIFNWSKAARELPNNKLRDLRAVWQCMRSDCDTLNSLKYGWMEKTANHDGAPEALQFVKSTDFGTDEFLFVNLMEAHSPYKAPAEYRTVTPTSIEPETLLGGGIDLSTSRNAYGDCVRYLSDIYHRIFRELEEDFDYVFTLSDHGELFGEHDAQGHFHGLYPELVHVPLCVSGDETWESTGQPRSLLDVHQTILSLTGIGGESTGIDLRQSVNERRFTEYHGLRKSRIRSFEEEEFEAEAVAKLDEPMVGVVGDDYYCYDTVSGVKSTGRSPPDTSNHRESRRDLIDERVNAVDEAEVSVSEGVQERLKDLGYA